MALTLYIHPLSSYCWKVLIALYEKAIPFEARTVNLGDPAERARYAALWPTAKIPLLDDGGMIVPETSIIIEHLERYPGAATLIPGDRDAQLQVRLWDRLSDCYIMEPMQRYVAQHLGSPEDRNAKACDDAKAAIRRGYDLFEQRLPKATWAAGNDFTMADCAAAPAFFYATTVVPIPQSHKRLHDYFESLMARPSVVRVIEEAGPFFKYYPFKEAIPSRFLAETKETI